MDNRLQMVIASGKRMILDMFHWISFMLFLKIVENGHALQVID